MIFDEEMADTTVLEKPIEMGTYVDNNLLAKKILKRDKMRGKPFSKEERYVLIESALEKLKYNEINLDDRKDITRKNILESYGNNARVLNIIGLIQNDAQREGGIEDTFKKYGIEDTFKKLDFFRGGLKKELPKLIQVERRRGWEVKKKKLERMRQIRLYQAQLRRISIEKQRQMEAEKRMKEDIDLAEIIRNMQGVAS